MNRRVLRAAVRVLAGVSGVALLAASRPNRPIRGAASAVIGLGLIDWALTGDP